MAGNLAGAKLIGVNSSEDLKHKYFDEYLRVNIDKNLERRAILEVAQHELTNEFYILKLEVLKAYVICCLENQTTSDDTFAIKLKEYSKAYDKLLSEAKLKELDGYIDKYNCPIARG